MSRLLPVHKLGTFACTDPCTPTEILKEGVEWARASGWARFRRDLCRGQPHREGCLHVCCPTYVPISKKWYFLSFIWLAITVFITILNRRISSAISGRGWVFFSFFCSYSMSFLTRSLLLSPAVHSSRSGRHSHSCWVQSVGSATRFPINLKKWVFHSLVFIYWLLADFFSIQCLRELISLVSFAFQKKKSQSVIFDIDFVWNGNVHIVLPQASETPTGSQGNPGN